MHCLRLFTLTVLGMLILAPMLAATPRIGQPAPDFTGVDSLGTQHTLSAYKGKVVVLEWTNHECPFVGKHYSTGNMQALQQYATANNVVWLSVISSAPGTQGHVSGTQARALTVERHATPTAVLLDEEGVAGRLYDARTTPHMYIINTAGTLVYMGGIDDKPSTRAADVQTATNYVRLALDEVLSGNPVSQAVTRPYGCSVKYRYPPCALKPAQTRKACNDCLSHKVGERTPRCYSTVQWDIRLSRARSAPDKTRTSDGNSL